mgnify:CR=1 FL=1
MKKLCLSILLLSIIFGSINAQEISKPKKQFETPYQKEKRLDLTVGGNLDLASSSTNPAAAVLGMRNTAAPFIEMRFTHLFARRLGWYAAGKLKIFKSRNEYDSTVDKIAQAFFEALFGPVTSLHIAYDAGMVYRMESTRWKCYPRIGIGANYYGENIKKEKEKGDETWKMDGNGNTFCLDFGVSTHYMILPNTSLVLDIAYQQPLTKAKANYLHTKGDQTLADHHFRSSTYGRELNVSGGISVTF